MGGHHHITRAADADRPWLAEFERDLIRARTAEGQARAKANGKHLGGPFKLTPHQQREAIKRRHENGAKWRSIPRDLGPWWMAAQTFIRWSQHGARERLMDLAQQRDGIALGMAFLDGTTIRAHQKAAGAVKKGASSTQRDKREALGRSRGGFSTKASVIVDGSGRAIGFALAPGQAHELPMAPVLLSFLTAMALWIVADRGYSSHAFRRLIWSLGARPAIPTRRNEAPVACPPWIYQNRNLVERF